MADRALIRSRGDDLAANMTRAGNASWQRGIAATPTQFLSYQARLMDAFIGKRFTPKAKLRALGIYSLVYGVPMTVAVPAGVWPWAEELDEYLLSKGIDPDKGILGAFLNGAVQTAMKLITGRDYAYSDRFSPGGINFFHDIFVEEGGYETIFGASGNILSETAKDALPFW